MRWHPKLRRRRAERRAITGRVAGVFSRGAVSDDPSMVHTSSDSFDQEDRPGAVLLAPWGGVLATRAGGPEVLAQRSPQTISAWPAELPAGHPRGVVSPHSVEVERSWLRDLDDRPWS
jgi:hypothetical protein